MTTHPVLIRPSGDTDLWVPGWEPWEFCASPVSGRDAIMAAPWPISWVYDGKTRHAVVPKDYRFGVATEKVSGFWMRVLRAVINCQRAQRLSAIHDLLYETRGGSAVALTCTMIPVLLPFRDVTRAEADAVAYAVAISDGFPRWEARLVHWSLSRFCADAWE